MTEGLLLSCLFAIVALPAALVPVFLGAPFAPLFTAGCCCLILGLIVIDARRSTDKQPVDTRLLGLSCLFAIVLCLLGGEGHFFYANLDWPYRDAVLHDLSEQPWPVLYRFQDQTLLLRAPLGMYIFPALVGKLLGFQAAEIGLLVQNSAIFALTFYFFLPPRSSLRAGLIVLGVFCVFNGWDVVGVALKYIFTGKPPLTDRIEWWAGAFQYSSMITQAFWVPNHAIPGWVFAGLFLKWMRGEVGIGLLLAAIPLFAFWSPLAAVGMLPFTAYAGITALVRHKISLADIVMAVCAVAAALPMLAYEHLAAGSVPQRFLWNDPIFSFIYPLFIALKVLPFIALLLFARKSSLPQPPLWLTSFVLLAIPFYRLGEANDFAMRASIPALSILALTLGQRCLQPQSRAWTDLVAITLSLGGVTGALEVHRAITQPRNPPGECNLIQIWQTMNPEWLFTHYIVPTQALPTWLHADQDQASTTMTIPCE